MYNNVGRERYRQHLSRSHEEVSKVQWQDQYEVELSMIAPIKKSFIPSEIIKGISFTRAGVELEPMQIGTTELYMFANGLPEIVSLTFYNQINITLQSKINNALFGGVEELEDKILNKVDEVIGGRFGFLDVSGATRNYIKDMFAPAKNFQSVVSNQIGSFLGANSTVSSIFSKISGDTIDLNTIDYFFKVGSYDILPKDGSHILPDDWYFRIELNALNGNWEEKRELSDYYLIDGEIEQEFSSDGGTMQEFTINFKRHRL